MKSVTQITVSELKKKLDNIIGFEIVGSHTAIANNIADLSDCNDSSLIWVSEKKARTIQLNEIVASLIFVPTSIRSEINADSKSCFIVSENPRLAFALVVNDILKVNKYDGIHPTAVIHPDAKIAANVTIGAFAVIGVAEINEFTRISSNCYIHDNTQIGKNVNISAGTIIGGPGFGYEKDEKGEWVLFPHIGGVIIEDNVDIGGNTCIDRGALGNTVLKKGCKVDNLVHIAHNAIIEENSLVIAHAMVAGSVKVGKNTWVAPGALIKNGLDIGDNVFIGLGAVVIKNIPNNETWIGNPAKPLVK